jgi:hypothetical protein
MRMLHIFYAHSSLKEKHIFFFFLLLFNTLPPLLCWCFAMLRHIHRHQTLEDINAAQDGNKIIFLMLPTSVVVVGV